MATTSAHEPGTPAWLDLMTPDLDKAQKFYGALFGWTFNVGSAETNHYTMCKLNGRNVAGIGKQPEGTPGFPTSWSVYFLTNDVDKTVGLVTEGGGKAVMPPMNVMNEGRMAVCMDPTGAVFGLWQPKAHHGAQVVDEPGAMVWHEVNTRNAPHARDFYAKVLGLTPQQMTGPMVYFTLHRGEKAEVGVLQMDDKWPKEVPPHWMNYFAVADTDAVAKKVTDLGGQVRVPPFDTTYGRIAVVADPMGATFSLMKPTT